MRYIDSYAIFESKAVTLKYIKKSLEDNFCAFMYRKKNGDKRYAFGTLRYDFIKKRWSPSPNGTKKKSPFTLVYWDLARKNFRQFRIGSFIKMIDKDPDLETFAGRHKEIYHKVRRYFPKKKKELVEPAEPAETDTAENTGENISEKLNIKPVDLKDFKRIYDDFDPLGNL